MKKLTAFSFLLLCAFVLQAQERAKTIDDLKYYIGYSNSDIQQVAKKKGYTAYFHDDDEKKGPFTYKFFMGEEYDLEIICNSEKVIGAAGEDFTPKEYTKILDYLKSNNYKLTVDEKMVVNAGFERVDLWVSSDRKWKVRVDYMVNSKEEPTKITLTTGMKYGFE